MKAMEKRADVEAMLTTADTKLGRLIRAVVSKDGPQRVPRSNASSFEVLVRAIVHQQMADQAATAIYQRLKSLGRSRLEPRDLLSATPNTLRRAGLSSAKVEYVRGLAQWFELEPELAKSLRELSNEQIIAALTSLPGIGAWTVNMLLIFSLQRPDVVPAGDLGIRRGVQLAYALDSPASAELVLDRSERWKPHRSLASIYLWAAVKLKLAPDDLRAPRRHVA